MQNKVSVQNSSELADLALCNGSNNKPEWPALFALTDACVACGLCESVCPANVEVLTLIDGIRAKIAPKRSWRGDLIGSVLARPALMRGLRTAAGLSQTRKIAKRLGFPAFAAAVRNTEPQPCNTPAQIVFSAGCANELVQPALADACLQIAHASKIPARIQQTCCGGYAKHRGQIKKASRLADEIATKQDPCCFAPSLFRANAAQSRGNLARAAREN